MNTWHSHLEERETHTQSQRVNAKMQSICALEVLRCLADSCDDGELVDNEGRESCDTCTLVDNEGRERAVIHVR